MRREARQRLAQMGDVLVAAAPLGEQLGVLDGHGRLAGDRLREAQFLARVLARALLVHDLEQAQAASLDDERDHEEAPVALAAQLGDLRGVGVGVVHVDDGGDLLARARAA